MRTKEKILNQALLLFNEKGVDQVSALQISQALGISYGNLTYHFKNKDAIILGLYQEVQQVIDATLAKLVQHLFEETFYLQLINEFFEITWRYRFIYLNLSSLMSQYPTIKAAERKYAKQRSKIFSKVKETFIREEYLKPESDIDYKLTIHSLSMILYAWILDAQLFYAGKEQSKIDYYVGLLYNMTIPILTPKGKEQLGQLRGRPIE